VAGSKIMTTSCSFFGGADVLIGDGEFVGFPLAAAAACIRAIF
jgi:hypothetical protein